MRKTPFTICRPSRNTIALAVLLAALQFMLAGCISGYGTLVQNDQLTRVFETYKVLPGYEYYFNGPEAEPYVIMGIKKEYTLQQGLWKKADITAEKLQDWVEQMANDPSARYTPFGSTMVDHTGKEIGIWYSKWDWTTLKRKEKTVIVYLPDTCFRGMKFTSDTTDCS